ncbi:MAG: pyrroline-5-carboxylate reductase [Anaerolineae bacterium]|nr:pyrroline-5-carboxylate reductase [Anaerolineae bacterium]
MLHHLRLAFVGSGQMAEAMIKGLLDRGMVAPDGVCASGPRQERADYLRTRFGIGVTTSNREAVYNADVVVLGVKPQMLPHVEPELRGLVRPDALVLSIIAGARLRSIAGGLGHAALVRAMPNTPARIGEGITVWTATPQVSLDQREQAQAILAALGEELYVEDESYLDMATALSGTGPAYIFLVMEALIDAGVHMGFSRYVAEKLVLQTMRGSVDFARQSGKHPAELRNQVTSPGGTSAEALYQLEKGGLRTVLSRAVYAAYQKSKYLGDLSEQRNNHTNHESE